MGEQTHGVYTVRLSLWLSLLLAVSACKPQRETAKKQAQLTTAPTAALSDAALEASTGENQDLLAQIAKQMVGLNPAIDDRQDHIGLANIARLVGYDLPLNDCGTSWLIASEGVDAAFTLSLGSRHDRGAGPNCSEADPHAPVKYFFKDWAVRPQGVTWQPFSASETAAEAPALLGQANTNGLKDITAGIDVQGRRLWTSHESVEVLSSGRPQGEALLVLYIRTTPKQPMAQAVGHRRTGYGLSAVAKAPATPDPSYTFSAGQLEPVTPVWVKVRCQAEVAVPGGCLYKSTLTAQLKQSKARFKADLLVAPESIGLSGRLGSQAPCNHLSLRRADGSCGGSMGPAHTGVEAWFGRGRAGLTFVDDLAAQASALQSDSSGNWDFTAMRLMPGQQSQGIPTFDWALRYFQMATYAKVSVLFDQQEEQVESCLLHSEILPGSAATCTAAPQDQVIAPTRLEAPP